MNKQIWICEIEFALKKMLYKAVSVGPTKCLKMFFSEIALCLTAIIKHIPKHSAIDKHDHFQYKGLLPNIHKLYLSILNEDGLY